MAVEHSALDIKLERPDRVYKPGDVVKGHVLVSAKGGWSHQGVNISVQGQAKLQLSSRSVGIFQSMSSLPPLSLFESQFVAQDPGRFTEGVTKVPFKFELPPKGLYESYHGVYISVSYFIHCSCERGMMQKGLARSVEFVIEVPEPTKTEPEPEAFAITPESLENVEESSISVIPTFNITGRLFHKMCPINLPFTGEITIQVSVAQVKSIELQLVRVESVMDSGNTAREATEIQNIQIADGDICRNLVIPLYMIFPRLFTCPTMITDSFKVEFEVNLIVVFVDGYMVTENFPIELYREKL